MAVTELLAPAKNKEIAIEAINCGADAVYIGAYSFGARQNASNSIEDISEVVQYAHKYNVKVFVTVNTILTDEELIKAVNLVKQLEKINVDAVIIQDLGLLKKIIDLKLSIPIHASTQCDNRTVEKVKFFHDIGINRVVLARELSIKQISEIHKIIPDIELESFVHGALCVSYSGQCYLSHYIGGRSANRGECAQPCRKKYSVIDSQDNYIAKDVYPLCMKDFNASGYLKQMIDAGVYSFKIEGRLKDINYVKNIVSYYRQELDKYSVKASSGRSLYQFIPDPEKSFNRGFTKYFLNDREDCCSINSPKSIGKYLGDVVSVNNKHFVLKTKLKISPQDGLCYVSENGLEGFLVNSAKFNSDESVEIIPNRNINVKVGDKLYRNSDIEFEKLLRLPVKRQIGVNINIENNNISATDEDGYIVSMDISNGESAKNQDKIREIFEKQFRKTGDSDFYINTYKSDSELPFLPISEINKLRRDIFNKLMFFRLNNYKMTVQNPMHGSKYYTDNVDYRANVHNKEAENFYNMCGVNVLEYSVEKNIPQKQIELMRTKHCIKYSLNMCKSPKQLLLKDEKGVLYPLKFDCKNCEMIVLSPMRFQVDAE